jgi:methyl-accepting chemotaxis protein
MSLTFKNKLLLSTIGLLLLTCTILAALSLYRLHTETRQALSYQLNATLAQARQVVSSWIESKSAVVRSATEHLPADLESISDFLTLSRASGGFDLFYVGTEDGLMLQSRPPVTLRPDYDPRARPWYKQVEAEKGLVLTPPYPRASTGELVVTVAAPMKEGFKGVVAGDVTLTHLVKSLLTVVTPWRSELWLVDAQGRLLAHPDTTIVKQQPYTELFAIDNDPFAGFEQVVYKNEKWLQHEAKLEGTGWKLVLLVHRQEALEPLYGLTWQLLLSSLAILVLASLFVYGMARYFSRPLIEATQALNRLAEGDIQQHMALSSKDEFGQISQAFNRLSEKLRTTLGQTGNLSRSLLTDIEKNSARASETLGASRAQHQVMQELSNAVLQISQATQNIAQNAEKTAASARHGVQASQQGLALVDESHQAIAELARQVHENGQNFVQLAQTVKNIRSLLNKINEIADQTNLLALNASIEAARAGEHGRGFAVVADEVRALSQNTQQATEAIAAMTRELENITHSTLAAMQENEKTAQKSMDEGQKACQQLQAITQSNGQICDMTLETATAVEQQKAMATDVQNQTRKIQDIAQAIGNAAQMHHEEAENLRTEIQTLQSHLQRAFRL